MKEIIIRSIKKTDNAALAAVIRNTLKEFGANRPGTVYFDESTDHLFELFQTEGSHYFVALEGESILGGAGIFPSAGLPDKTAELVKMYLTPESRNKGIGRQLIARCLDFAKAAGYEQVYLETMPELKKAIHVYEKNGFEYLKGPLGNTGHFGCAIWMVKRI